MTHPTSNNRTCLKHGPHGPGECPQCDELAEARSIVATTYIPPAHDARFEAWWAANPEPWNDAKTLARLAWQSAISGDSSQVETKKDGPGNRSVTLNGYQLKAALEFLAPDNDPDQLESEVSIQWGEAGHSGANYYCCMAEYPEEGSIALDDKPPSVVETGPKPDAEKAPVTSDEMCPTWDQVQHKEHNGKCVYCGAPMPSQSKVTPEWSCVCGEPLPDRNAMCPKCFPVKASADEIGNHCKRHPAARYVLKYGCPSCSDRLPAYSLPKASEPQPDPIPARYWEHK